ncbi:MAG: hypothetical protein BAJALOKI1v1_110043 [Promethearchaeota archaeon]|nr:MAG: hypothetical protein BAJALOKI1v1_110043 [Candidatus Lokiarchaeota archaeon]
MIGFFIVHDVASCIEIRIQAQTTMRTGTLLAGAIAKLATTGAPIGLLVAGNPATYRARVIHYHVLFFLLILSLFQNSE